MANKPDDFFKLTASFFRARSDASVFSCRFEKSVGWAILFLHEETGTVAIHSDYGDWVHSWPAPGRGEVSLREFVCHGSYDYMAHKFMGKDGAEEFDFVGTVKEIRDQILDRRRARDLDKDKARELFDDLEREEETTDEGRFWENLDHDVAEFIENDFFAYARHQVSATFRWLRDGILPALVEELRKTLPKEEVA